MQSMYEKNQVRESERKNIYVPPIAKHKEDPIVDPKTKVAPLEVIPSKVVSIASNQKVMTEKLLGKPTFAVSSVQCECGAFMRILREWSDGTTTYSCPTDGKKMRF